MREDEPLQFTSVHAISKKTQEELALCFGRAYRIPTLTLRFFFGSRQALSNPYTGGRRDLMGRLKNGKPPMIFEDGRQSRDFIHVFDVVGAVVRSVEAEEVTGAFSVCTGGPVTIRRVAETRAERLGAELSPEMLGRYRAGDIRRCLGSPDRAREVLGFRAG